MDNSVQEKSIEFIEEITQNTNAVQQSLLAEILKKNANTEYLRDYNLDGASDPTTIFKSEIPMIRYEDIQPFIQRIADGDHSPILTTNSITFLNLSTGTSGGARKPIPSNEEELAHISNLCVACIPILKRQVKEVEKGKGLCFWFIKEEVVTKGGLKAQSFSSIVYRRTACLPHIKYIYTSPKEAILCLDMFQSMYTQMLCGLYQRQQVVWLQASFANILVWAMNFLRQNWQQLAHDIQTGTLNPQLTDVSIRECMTPVVQPDPELAALITQECGKDDWEGIIARIWPNAKYLDAIVSGSMAQYIPTLDYYTGGLPKVSMNYACSECFIGINLNPICSPSEIAYTIMPNMAYFEFLPHGHGVDSSKEQLVNLADVEVGKEYELVITTRVGLYRYRTGDILRVVGFHNSAPKVQFVRRKNMVLSIDMDKTDEVQLQAAVDSAGRLLQEFKTSVVEYTSFADTKSFPGHYVIFWELGGENLPSDKVVEQCCLAMEESLDDMYLASRVVHKLIGPLEIRVVKKGTFEEVMEQAITNGASISQYKVPRCVTNKSTLDLLDSRVVSTHFSPSIPAFTSKPV